MPSTEVNVSKDPTSLRKSRKLTLKVKVPEPLASQVASSSTDDPIGARPQNKDARRSTSAASPASDCFQQHRFADTERRRSQLLELRQQATMAEQNYIQSLDARHESLQRVVKEMEEAIIYLRSKHARDIEQAVSSKNEEISRLRSERTQVTQKHKDEVNRLALQLRMSEVRVKTKDEEIKELQQQVSKAAALKRKLAVYLRDTDFREENLLTKSDEQNVMQKRRTSEADYLEPKDLISLAAIETDIQHKRAGEISWGSFGNAAHQEAAEAEESITVRAAHKSKSSDIIYSDVIEIPAKQLAGAYVATKNNKNEKGGRTADEESLSANLIENEQEKENEMEDSESSLTPDDSGDSDWDATQDRVTVTCWPR